MRATRPRARALRGSIQKGEAYRRCGRTCSLPTQIMRSGSNTISPTCTANECTDRCPRGHNTNECRTLPRRWEPHGNAPQARRVRAQRSGRRVDSNGTGRRVQRRTARDGTEGARFSGSAGTHRVRRHSLRAGGSGRAACCTGFRSGHCQSRLRPVAVGGLRQAQWRTVQFCHRTHAGAAASAPSRRKGH
jgi:hypothetical protein